MRPLITVLGVLIALVGLIPQSLAADVESEQYFLPLLPPYGIHQVPGHPTGDQGRFRLAERSSSSRNIASYTLIPAVERVAVSGRLIVGKARKGYFLLDTRQSEAEPRFFDSAEEWQSALSLGGVSAVPQLSDPNALAAALPDMTLRPWKYRVMHGLWGQCDDAWACIVQLAGVVIVFLGGLFTRSKALLMALAALAGIVVNVIAHVVMTDGGPGAFVGLFMLPIFFAMVAYLSNLLRRIVIAVTVRLRGWGREARKAEVNAIS